MSLAFFEAPPTPEVSERDRLGADISAWIERNHDVRRPEASGVERDRMLIAFLGAASVLQSLIGAEAIATLLHGEFAAASRRVDLDRAMARRS